MNGQFDLAPSEWATLRRLLGDALDRPAAERATWVEHLDVQFDVFKPRLRALLAHAARGTGALALDTLPKVETAQFIADRSAVADADTLQAGARVGPYRLLRLLGAGGMGEVWLAERTDVLQRRQVALKLPRLLTGRADLAERLAREREILATLEHPNIARLYDAGLTADGQPYLALEYVEGERIDTYCTRRALDVPARLRLFLQVARAVAHAHAHLVVHRDLKPANILVTEAGDVRLLDFGIAKLLDRRPRPGDRTDPARRARADARLRGARADPRPADRHRGRRLFAGRGAVRAADRQPTVPAQARVARRAGRGDRAGRAGRARATSPPTRS